MCGASELDICFKVTGKRAQNRTEPSETKESRRPERARTCRTFFYCSQFVSHKVCGCWYSAQHDTVRHATVKIQAVYNANCIAARWGSEISIRKPGILPTENLSKTAVAVEIGQVWYDKKRSGTTENVTMRYTDRCLPITASPAAARDTGLTAVPALVSALPCVAHAAPLVVRALPISLPTSWRLRCASPPVFLAADFARYCCKRSERLLRQQSLYSPGPNPRSLYKVFRSCMIFCAASSRLVAAIRSRT